MKEIKATIITIGDELLIGQTIDTNSAWMAQRLNEVGIWINKRIAIGDVAEDIINALDLESEEADIILITGGLGPTDDDKTKNVLCDYFDSELVLDEKILELIEQRISHHSAPLLERNRAQALVPHNSTPLLNGRGTAPGLWFEKSGKIYVAMPGVPFEMEGLMVKEVIPRLLEHFTIPAILYRTYITTGVPESVLAEKLNSLEMSLPAHIQLAYLPGNGILKLRLTAKGDEQQKISHELDQYGSVLLHSISDCVIAKEDISLPELAGGILREGGLSVSTAESCTGGYIGHLLTSVPGSSAYFSGSIVTYTNALKQALLHVPEAILTEKGAVSEEVVKAMLKGVILELKTDVGIAVSGIMGPDGGTVKKPVGTVWVAAGNGNFMLTRKLQLRYDRQKNIEMTANYALILLLDAIKNISK